MVATREWVLLSYRLPREPSTPRIALWRKLRRLGVAQVLDGLVALPATDQNREQFDWLADEVVAKGGDAGVWVARAGSRAQERALRDRMTADVEAEYDALAEEAAAVVSAEDPRAADRFRRELQRIRRRDHFGASGYQRAVAAVRALERSGAAR